MSFPALETSSHIFFELHNCCFTQMLWDLYWPKTTSKISSNMIFFFLFVCPIFVTWGASLPKKSTITINCPLKRPLVFVERTMKVMTITTWSSSSIARCVCKSQDLPLNPIVFSSPWRQGGFCPLSAAFWKNTFCVFKGRGRMRETTALKWVSFRFDRTFVTPVIHSIQMNCIGHLTCKRCIFVENSSQRMVGLFHLHLGNRIKNRLARVLRVYQYVRWYARFFSKGRFAGKFSCLFWVSLSKGLPRKLVARCECFPPSTACDFHIPLAIILRRCPRWQAGCIPVVVRSWGGEGEALAKLQVVPGHWERCYCWWPKSGDHQLRLVVYPIIYIQGFIHPRGRKISSINSMTGTCRFIWWWQKHLSFSKAKSSGNAGFSLCHLGLPERIRMCIFHQHGRYNTLRKLFVWRDKGDIPQAEPQQRAWLIWEVILIPSTKYSIDMISPNSLSCPIFSGNFILSYPREIVPTIAEKHGIFWIAALLVEVGDESLPFLFVQAPEDLRQVFGGSWSGFLYLFSKVSQKGTCWGSWCLYHPLHRFFLVGVVKSSWIWRSRSGVADDLNWSGFPLLHHWASCEWYTHLEPCSWPSTPKNWRNLQMGLVFLKITVWSYMVAPVRDTML